MSEHPARISANESATGTVDDKLDQLEVPQTAKTTAPYLDLASLRKSAIAALDGTRIELQTSLDVLEDVELEDLAAKREFCHELTKALRICHCRLVAP